MNIRSSFAQSLSSCCVAGMLLLLTGGQVTAQLANPSAAALGTGDNHTAVARGFSAIAWNPAGLAMPGGPGSSVALFPLYVVAGLGPIGLSDFKAVEGQIVPDQVKTEWYDRIAAAGREEGSAGTDVTLLAVQIWRVGFQLSSSARFSGSLGPGAADLLLFGNAGRTGEPADFSLEGSAFDVAILSTAGLSYAHPIIREPGRSLSVGATLKQTIGHGLLTGVDLGSQLSSDPLDLRISFPIVQTDTVPAFENGRGMSLDVGAAWEQGPLLAGVVVRNLVNGFAWDEDKLFYRPGNTVATPSEVTTDFELNPFTGAPERLRERVSELGFSPVVALGAGYRFGERLLLTGDVRRRMGDSRLAGPETHIGVGAELRPVQWLPLRAGGAMITGGYLLSGGVGLRLGPLRLAGSGALTKNEFGSGSSALLTLSGGGF